MGRRAGSGDGQYRCRASDVLDAAIRASLERGGRCAVRSEAGRPQLRDGGPRRQSNPGGLMRSALFLSALCAAASGQCADLQMTQLHEMSLNDVLAVDISTGTSKLLHQAPGVAYVLTADDIARLGARNLLEVLESIPGMNVYLYQGVVDSPVIDARGLVGERGGYVLFLRDGRPLRLLGVNTMPEIFRLPVNFVERIEVIRGPASAVYGADALAGAVNVITKKAPAEAGARIGSFDDRAGWAGYSAHAGPVEWSATASRARNIEQMVTRSRLLRLTYDQDFRHEYTDLDVKARAGGFAASIWALNYQKRETDNPGNPAGVT